MKNSEKNIEHFIPILLKEDFDNIKVSFDNSDWCYSDIIKELSSITFNDNLISFSEKAEYSFSHIKPESYLVFEGLSELEFLKNHGEAKLADLNASYKRRSLYSKYKSYINNKLRKKKTAELLLLYKREKNTEIKEVIWDFIIQHLQAISFKKIIKKINSWKKRIVFQLSTFKRNRRLSIRRIISFLFKNLDDYHSISIIKNLQFKVVNQPPVLILNNRIHETKYIKTN